MMDRIPDRDDIEAAAARVVPHVQLTPVLTLAPGAMGGNWVPQLKLEMLQHTGSFKARGAFNNLLSRPVGAGGVTAVTGGNHGAAVACAARKLGIRARIFVPSYAPAAKVAPIRGYGADIDISTGDFHAAQASCDAQVAESGALKVHPFAEPATIAGQGTLFREWQGQGGLATVVIAVGGGGLIGGAALWFQGQDVRFVGVEPEGAAALSQALQAGGPQEVINHSVAADSLGPQCRAAGLSDLRGWNGSGGAGQRCGNPRRATQPVAGVPHRQRTGRCHGVGGAAGRGLSPCGRRKGGHSAVRGQCRSDGTGKGCGAGLTAEGRTAGKGRGFTPPHPRGIFSGRK